MDSRDIKYKFDQAKHKAAKTLSKKDSHFFSHNGIVYTSAMLATNLLFFGGVMMNNDLDTQTTANTDVVAQELVDEYNALLTDGDADPDLDAHKAFMDNLVLAEDISETQMQELLDIYQEVHGDVQDMVGYELGSIDDLREVRAELGEGASAEEVAAATVDAQETEDLIRDIHMGSGAVFVLLFLGMIMGRSRSVKRSAEKKPRNPIFKH